MRLPDRWEEDAARVARISASRFRGGQMFTYHERVDLALGGVIEALAELGRWPADEKPLFRAADNAIRREEREHTRHIVHWTFWYEPRSGADTMAEQVTDKIAIWEVAWALSPGQWAAVWAWSETLKRNGTHRDAAALIGSTLGTYYAQLTLARKRARAWWVAPGDTPRGHWSQDKTSVRGDGYSHQMRRRLRRRAGGRAA